MTTCGDRDDARMAVTSRRDHGGRGRSGRFAASVPALTIITRITEVSVELAAVPQAPGASLHSIHKEFHMRIQGRLLRPSTLGLLLARPRAGLSSTGSSFSGSSSARSSSTVGSRHLPPAIVRPAQYVFATPNVIAPAGGSHFHSCPAAAIAQARDPNLPPPMCRWWYWSAS
jgi:hypothetical protein